MKITDKMMLDFVVRKSNKCLLPLFLTRERLRYFVRKEAAIRAGRQGKRS